MSATAAMKRKAEVDDNYERDETDKRARSSTPAQDTVQHRKTPAPRESAARCKEKIEKIAADALSMLPPASPVKKQFPPGKYVPGVNAALKAARVERTSLGKATPESVKDLASSDNATKQDSLLGSPETMLAQSNAFNITFHRLVRENAELKQTNAELVKKSISDREVRLKAEQEGNVKMQNEMTALERCIAYVEDENGRLKEEVKKAKEEASANKATADSLSHKLKTILGLAKDA